VKSYSGYVHLPPDPEIGQPYPANMFFWFFESRKNPQNASLALWLNGGPGASSLISLASENGPCFVNEDSNSTTLNQWSWNREANILYVDQPVQTGYSYDTLINGTLNQLTSNVTPMDFSSGVPDSNETVVVGTFGSNNTMNTANTTSNAARVMWKFMQVWMGE
jgi:carboxypeptidase C (cathepsin A)